MKNKPSSKLRLSSSGKARGKLMVVLIRDVATGKCGGGRPQILGLEKSQVNWVITFAKPSDF